MTIDWLPFSLLQSNSPLTIHDKIQILVGKRQLGKKFVKKELLKNSNSVDNSTRQVSLARAIKIGKFESYRTVFLYLELLL